ncbi:MAG: hypothetical protein D6713_10220 [Deltaproteobacteria bacterium]|nr:MAG: hypothetical protein D6713_10220 [Deltaproteobacteria bacterium]
MSYEEKRKNIINYYLTITTGVFLGFLNSNIIFFVSMSYLGTWWSYVGVVTGILGIYYGLIRLRIDYQTLRHSLENIKRGG